MAIKANDWPTNSELEALRRAILRLWGPEQAQIVEKCEALLDDARRYFGRVQEMSKAMDRAMDALEEGFDWREAGYDGD